MPPKHGKYDTTLPCAQTSTKFVCLPTEVNTQRKINQAHNPQSLKTLQALNKLCDDHKDIFYFTKVI